ncbi:hypothetical protein [Shewanella sp. ISTPL2]|uniref:hypothetical protein n=1 Tax=Shewanella sp. ISTPL2 TaxID=2699425 RepID=UPI0015692995|nr:hypothetical protein [Shewanella sp. ISTPL2]
MSTVKLKDYRPFQIIFIIGLIIFTMSSISIIINDVLEYDSKLCASNICFSTSLFSFPIDVAKATVALLALAALLHKSEETQYQIKISISQNTYSNYFHHRKIINEELDSKLLDSDVKIVSFNSFYNLLFPKNKPNKFEFTSDINDVEVLYRDFFDNLFSQSSFARIYGRGGSLGTGVVRLGSVSIKDKFDIIREFDDAIFELLESLGLRGATEHYTLNKSYAVYKSRALSLEEFSTVEYESISSYDISKMLILIRNIGEVINKLSYSNRELSFLTVGDDIFRQNFSTKDTFFMVVGNIDAQKKKIIKDIIQP